MCYGTGLLLFKISLIQVVQITDKSLILQNPCVEMELWPSETQTSGFYEARQANVGP